jgi:hypothetical protein
MENAAVHEAGCWFTEEPQSVMDDEFGGCLRHLCVAAEPGDD